MLRRDFIKTTCVTCAGVLGGGALLSMLNSCAPLPVIKTSSKDKTLLIPESSFADKQNLLIIKNSNFDFDILLVKKKDNTYNALYMQCSHENQPLSATKSGLFCSSHGSAFNLEGEVTVQPATKPLKKFKTQIENNNIIIYLTT
ncbi:MAG: Rieske 2Fe-2S domain-containing protein [Bacteroidota bacterium]